MLKEIMYVVFSDTGYVNSLSNTFRRSNTYECQMKLSI